MKRFFNVLLCALVGLTAMTAGRDSYTVLVSLDALRWDYVEAYDTPFLRSMGTRGVKAVMTPSFPSKTFPNHYTMATGLVPDHHGIIGNQFRCKDGRIYSAGNATATDGALYGGEPMWLTAKRQGVKSATVYWVGSDVAIKGEHANYWNDYNARPRLSMSQRVDEVIRLLSLDEDERPHLVMAYFEEPDASGHDFGPISMHTRRTMECMDSLMCNLYDRLMQLPIAGEINFIVTGDHGMTHLSPERVIPIKKYVKDEWVTSVCNDFPTLFYATSPECADSIVDAFKCVDHLRVWRRGECPEYTNYGTNENMGDVIVMPDLGWKLTDRRVSRNTGTHGYDHTYSDMWIAFQAIGPDFKQGYEHTATFGNVCLYPLVCHLLGLTPQPCDGSLNDVMPLLQ